MQHRTRHRTARWLAAACAAVVLAGCGGNPLESVGERSNEWIGPIADGVTLLSNDPPPAVTADADPAEASVSVAEGDG